MPSQPAKYMHAAPGNRLFLTASASAAAEVMPTRWLIETDRVGQRKSALVQADVDDGPRRHAQSGAVLLVAFGWG